MITLEQIQKRLSQALKDSNLSQAEIARQLGVRHQTVNQYVQGRAFPAPDTLANLCKIIEVSPSYLFFFDDSI